MDSPHLSEYLPLGEAAFYILLSLGDGEKHGYAILKDVQTISDGARRLSVSTLYETLSRLLEQGLVDVKQRCVDVGQRLTRLCLIHHLLCHSGFSCCWR